MRTRFAVLIVISAVLCLCVSGAFAADSLSIKELQANPQSYLNGTVTVRGQIGSFAKDPDQNYKYRYTLTYRGSEVTVFTNSFVDEGQSRTVTGQLKYDGDMQPPYYLVESGGPPPWMLILGGVLVIVLVVVIVLIVKTPKAGTATGPAEPYCDQCGAVLSANGACPVCSGALVTAGPTHGEPPIETGGETIGITGSQQGTRKKLETVLMGKTKALLVMIDGPGGEFRLGDGSKKIGRDSGNDIAIPEETVSGEHAKIIEDDGEFFVQDIGSKNGTYVNDEKVFRQQLKDGDIIKLGKVEMKFVLGKK